jgi:ectoine hydroxylase-related dioxygenase (phytanoyl-CoA dioxygenase family)
MLLGKDQIDLLEKIPFRIDCPMVMRELAVWHQDIHYVKGSPETVTAWIPLFDASFKEGCLLIMPESHKLGPVAHDVPVLGKKFFPSGFLTVPCATSR